MGEQVAAAMRHAKSYANKVNEAKEPAKLPTQCATCNMAVSFIDDDLLPGSKPTIAHCLSLAIFGAKSQTHLGRWWLGGQHHAQVHYERLRDYY